MTENLNFICLFLKYRYNKQFNNCLKIMHKKISTTFSFWCKICLNNDNNPESYAIF